MRILNTDIASLKFSRVKDFLPRYLACRAGFDLGFMLLLPVLRACCACLLA